MHNKCTGKNVEGGDYQFSLCQKIEYHWGKQEGSGCQLPGEDDLTTRLPLSVTLFSQWCMDVVRHQSPSRTSQYYHAEECYSETMGDCDPCYGMTKLHQGGGEAYRRRVGVCFIQYNKVSSPAVALKWLNVAKMSLQMLRKHILGFAVARNVVVSLVYWQYYDLFLKYNRPFQVWNKQRPGPLSLRQTTNLYQDRFRLSVLIHEH